MDNSKSKRVNPIVRNKTTVPFYAKSTKTIARHNRTLPVTQDVTKMVTHKTTKHASVKFPGHWTSKSARMSSIWSQPCKAIVYRTQPHLRSSLCHRRTRSSSVHNSAFIGIAHRAATLRGIAIVRRQVGGLLLLQLLVATIITSCDIVRQELRFPTKKAWDPSTQLCTDMPHRAMDDDNRPHAYFLVKHRSSPKPRRAAPTFGRRSEPCLAD